jgi:tRNA G18 (ribose-2'-O)-methylase SpoU
VSSVLLSELTLDKPTILVLGNEGHGIRTNILRRSDQQVKIPTYGEAKSNDVDSLNVSVSGGIILHHILSMKAAKVV